jgi:hypothetical protein
MAPSKKKMKAGGLITEEIIIGVEANQNVVGLCLRTYYEI